MGSAVDTAREASVRGEMEVRRLMTAEAVRLELLSGRFRSGGSADSFPSKHNSKYQGTSCAGTLVIHVQARNPPKLTVTHIPKPRAFEIRSRAENVVSTMPTESMQAVG